VFPRYNRILGNQDLEKQGEAQYVCQPMKFWYGAAPCDGADEGV